MSKTDKVSAIVVVILTGVVVYFLTTELRGKGYQLNLALKHLDWRWLVGGLVMMLLSILLEAIATYVMLNKSDRHRTSVIALLRVPLLNLLGTGSVSYTHLTLPTICSV